MRPRYYFWYALGFFTVFTAVDGVYSRIFGPSRISTLVAAPIYLFTGCFFSLVLWVQMACIAKFHRPWFQIKDTFVTAFAAGIFLAAFLMATAYPMSRLNIPNPLPFLFILLLPVPSLWAGSVLVSKLSRTNRK